MKRKIFSDGNEGDPGSFVSSSIPLASSGSFTSCSCCLLVLVMLQAVEGGSRIISGVGGVVPNHLNQLLSMLACFPYFRLRLHSPLKRTNIDTTAYSAKVVA